MAQAASDVAAIGTEHDGRRRIADPVEEAERREVRPANLVHRADPADRPQHDAVKKGLNGKTVVVLRRLVEHQSGSLQTVDQPHSRRELLQREIGRHVLVLLGLRDRQVEILRGAGLHRLARMVDVAGKARLFDSQLVHVTKPLQGALVAVHEIHAPVQPAHEPSDGLGFLGQGPRRHHIDPRGLVFHGDHLSAARDDPDLAFIGGEEIHRRQRKPHVDLAGHHRRLNRGRIAAGDGLHIGDLVLLEQAQENELAGRTVAGERHAPSGCVGQALDRESAGTYQKTSDVPVKADDTISSGPPLAIAPNVARNPVDTEISTLPDIKAWIGSPPPLANSNSTSRP